MFATQEHINQLHKLVANGTKRQKRDLAPLLAEEGLTPEDLATKSVKALSTPDLNIRALIFAVS